MIRDWESIFTTWAQGSSETEKTKSENAERQVREAIAASPKLQKRNIVVFTQGSYRNRVNVRKESDVDIGILCYDTFFPDYPDDNIKMMLEQRMDKADYTYATFKNEIEEALVGRFGRSSVVRGNKAFDVKENSYRVEADVAAFFEHRRYTSQTEYISGVEMIPDNLKPIIVRNWPEQHYRNGVYKNDNTQRRFKRIVRVLKTLSNEMASEGIAVAKQTPSFLTECLVWNAPTSSFSFETYKSMLRNVLAHLFNNTLTAEKCLEWGEVSELKYLFRSSQPWTYQQAHNFISSAWDYVGYE